MTRGRSSSGLCRTILGWTSRLWDRLRLTRRGGAARLERLESRVLCSATPPPLNVAVVDRTLPEARTLISAALGRTRVLTYDGLRESAEEVLQRLVAVAGDGRRLQSVSVFSHGARGEFLLGNELITGESLQRAGLATDWRRLGDAMEPGGDIYLFGCNVADGVSGRRLLGKLSELTRAKVFGSTNITGVGGDWELESVAQGRFVRRAGEEAIPFSRSVLAAYPADLALPAYWSNMDFGAPGVAGSSSTNASNVFTITGDGGGFAGTSDVGQFAYTTMTGDGDLIARVASQTATPNGATAGVMIRNALTAGSMNAYLYLTSGGGLTFNARTTDNTKPPASPLGTQTGTAPVWVRINRAGTTFTGYYSADGVTWTSLGSTTIAMGTTVYVGMAVSSKNSTTSTATFDNVSALVAPTGLTVAPVTTTSMALSWNDNSALEDGYLVERSANGVSGWNQVTQTATGSQTCTDTGLAPGTNYYYRVRALSGSNYTAFSAVVGATTLPGTTGLAAGEMFNYPNAAALGTQSGGTGFSDTWSVPSGGATVASSGLTYSNLVTGGRAIGLSGSGLYASRNLTTAIGTTGTTRWMSFLIRRDTADPGGAYGGFYIGSLGIGENSSANWLMQTTDGTGIVSSSTSIVTGTTYLLVMKMVFLAGNDQFTLYVNPAPGNSAPSGGVTKSDLDLGLQTTLTMTWNASNFTVDEFRLGNTYADVAPEIQPLVEATSSTQVYAKNGGPLAVDPGMLVTHPQGTSLTGATVQITGNYQSGQDALSFTNQNGITGSWNSSTGTLTLSGTASAATYQTALESVTYANSSSTPNTSTRTVTFTVTDTLGASSNPETRNLSVVDLQSGLGAHWTFDDGSGTTAHDAIGGHHGAFVNTPTWVAGQLGGALSASGTGYASATPGTLGQNQGTITLASWVKLSTITGAGQVIVAIEDNGSTNQSRAALMITATGALEAMARDVDGGSASYAISSATLSAGVWTHVAAVIDYAANTITLYINGSPAAAGSSVLTNFTAATATPNTQAGGVGLGAHADGSQNLNGTIDDLRVYHRGLSAGDIAALANVPAVGNTAPVATADAYSVNEDITLSVAAAGVLANDTDADGDRIAAVLETGPAHGTLTLNADGSFTYLGASNYNGADSFTYRAYDGTDLSAPVTVSITVNPVNDAPTVAAPAAASPSPVTGTTTALSVLGTDVDNTEPTLTYTWAVTAKPAGAANPTYSANGTNAAKNTTATFSKAGTYTFQVTISDGSLTTTSSVSVTVNQTLTSMAVSPASAALNLNATQQFTATGYDQLGAAMSPQPIFTWSLTSGVGSVNAAGLYSSAAATGSAMVKAASGALSATASVTVTNANPTVATPAAATPNNVIGTSTALSVLGTDDGGESNLTYTWSATSQPAGSTVGFSANGTNAAKNCTATFDKPGNYTFQVVISDGTSSVTSSATLVSALGIYSGQVGHWPFDTDANDASGNGNNGTLTNGALIDTTAASKKVGAGKLSLDGVNDYVDLSSHLSSFSGLSQGTISAWIKTTGNNCDIFTATNVSTKDYFEFYVWGGQLEFEIQQGGADLLDVSSNAKVNDGNWHHVAVTMGSTGSKLYIDGAPAASTYWTGNASTQAFLNSVAGLNFLAIGIYKDSGGFADPFAGYVDDERVYNRAITATEIAQLATIAPILDSSKSPVLAGENQDSAVPSGAVGTLVSSLVDLASPSGQVDNVTDVNDATLLGIAVTAADTANGSWWYSTNGGTSWSVLGAVANNNARLLAADTNTRIYFQPNPGYAGTLASAITFRAWDQTTGSNGGLADTTGNGGSTAFSSATDTASLYVNAAPTVVTAAQACPSPVTGTTTGLSALGGDDGGEASLTYTWAATSKPAGASPLFSANGTNAAKNSTVTFDKAGTYTFQVTISDGSLATTSSVSVTVDQTLTSITVAPASAALNLNATQLFTATGYDQFAAAMSAQPAFTWAKVSGVGSVDATGLYSSGASAGSATISATSGAVSGTASATVTNATPTVSMAASASPTTVTGTTTALSVLGADDGGEANLTYSWSATSSPGGSNPAFSANGTNAAKNSTVTFDKAGTYTFHVVISDGTNTVTSSVAVTVNQTLTSISVSPASAALNQNQTVPLSATAYDQFGAAIAAQPTFTWTVASGGGSVSSSGLYSSLTAAGISTITAASGAISGSASITVTNATPTVATPAAASPSPVTGTSTALSVLGADDGGEANLTYTWSATARPAGSNPVFSANGTNAAKNSTVTFDKAGNYTFQATISDGNSTVTSSVAVTVNQTLTSITVTPASASLNLNGTQQFTVTAYDQFGGAMSPQPAFTWTTPSGVGSVDATGLYSAGASAGSATISAQSGAITGTASITVTDAAPTVSTSATATPATVTATTTSLSVLGADDGGEANLTYTWSATSSPAGANPLFSANGSNTAKNASVTFDMAGIYTFQVVISDGNSSVTSSVTVTVDQTLTSIAISPASASLNLNATQPFTAVAYDQFGVPMASQPTLAWAVDSGVGSIDAAGLYSSGASAGAATISASSGGKSAAASVTVIDTSPTVTSVTASPPTVTGTSIALAVVADDDGGESNLTYTWTVTASPAGSTPLFSHNADNVARNATVTFDAAGNYTFQVVISDGTQTVTRSISVDVQQTLSTINVSPASASLNLNDTQQFTAVAYDQFGAPMSAQPAITWARQSGVGSIDATGLYDSGLAAGSATVTATSGSITGSASISVTDAAPTVATPASATPTPVTGISTALAVLGDDDAGEASLTYTWTVIASPAGANPAFSDNGTNAAKNTTVTFDAAGSYTFLVTLRDTAGLTVTSSVSVTVDQTLTAINVAPGSTSLGLSDTQQFTATACDQFGEAMSPQPAFTWSVTSGGGSVDAAGLYTAPAGAGSAVVQATSASVSGSAAVDIVSGISVSATPDPVTGTTTALSVTGATSPALTYTWAVIAKPADAADPLFGDNATNSARNASATFSKAGSYTFQVDISDGTTSTTETLVVAVDQTLTTIQVLPATAALNLNGTQQFTATGYDQFGDPMSSPPAYSWGLTSGAGSVDATGLYTAPAAPGSVTVRASCGSIEASATVTITDAPPTVSSPAAATPATVTGTTTALSVLGDDDGGEANLTYIWALAGTPPAPVLFSANGNNATKSVTATFGAAGTYTFVVTISDGTHSVISSVAVMVDQALTSIAVSPAAASLSLNASQSFSATAYDQFGAALQSQPAFTWSTPSGVGAINSSGLYTSGPTPGTATISAAAGAVTGTASVTVTDAGPTVATPASATPAAVTGTTTLLSVVGADDGGEASLTYTWSVTAAPAGSSPRFSANSTNAAKTVNVTVDAAGTYNFFVTISDGNAAATSSVTVSVSQTLTAIVVTPGSASLNLNQSAAFSATGYDQFGAALAVQPSFTWMKVSGFGSISAAGLYTSGTLPGIAVLRAFSGLVAGTASVTVTNAAPTIASPAAAAPATVAGTSTSLSVLGDDDGGEANLNYTWSVLAAPAGAPAPVFSRNASNAAKSLQATFAKAGVYRLQVAVSDGSSAVTSTVDVTVAQTLTQLVLAPSSLTLIAGNTQAFAATALDQFGDPISPPPPIAYSVDPSGVGTIDSSGLYVTALDASGSAVVRATLAGLSATASITVNPASLPAPDQVLAESSGSQTFLAWHYGSQGQSGFLIQRSLDGSTWHEVGTTGPDLRTYVDNGLSAGTTYAYRVLACRGSLASDPSAVVRVTTASPYVPPTTGGTSPGGAQTTGPQPPVAGGGNTGGPSTEPPSEPQKPATDPGAHKPGTETAPKPPPPPGNTGAVDTAPPPANDPSDGGRQSTPQAQPDANPAGKPGETVQSTPGQTTRRDAAPNQPRPNTDLGPTRSTPESRAISVSSPAAGPAAAPSPAPPQPPPAALNAVAPTGKLVAPATLEMAQATAAAFHELETRGEVIKQEQASTEQVTAHKRRERVTVGTAAVVGATAVAGYLVWLVQGGSLLMSFVSTMPFWRWFDPLPVLDSWEGRSASRVDGKKDKKKNDDEKELNGILD